MLWLWLGAALAAAPATLVGTVGDYPVRLTLAVPPATGTLTYVRKNAGFGLSGACDAACALTELGPDGAPTGAITATWSGALLDGTWETPDHKKKLPFHAESGADAAVVWARSETWARPADARKPDPVKAVLPAILVPDPQIQARLDALFVPQRFLDETQAEAVANGWVDETSYEVAFDRAGVVAVNVWVDGSGAYPDRFSRALTVDTRTGAELGVDTFTAAGREQLVRFANEEVHRRQAAAEPEVVDLVAEVTFSEKNLAGFYPTEAGLVLTVHWGVPHVVMAAAPDPLIVVPWATVRTALAPGSPLERVATPAQK